VTCAIVVELISTSIEPEAAAAMRAYACVVALAIACLASGQKCGVSRTLYDEGSYIVGGKEVAKNEVPWQISLQVETRDKIWIWQKKWEHICGGSIVNEYWIVTAAHCIMKSNYRVVVGAHDITKTESSQQKIDVAAIVVHPNWDEAETNYDIALIKLVSPIKLDGRTAVPICLPEVDETFERESCIATGWGRTKEGGVGSDVLLKVALPIVPTSRCASAYRNVMGATISSTKICAGRTDSFGFGVCQGDSGGPLVCKRNGVYKLAGLTSFGVVCGSNEHPAVFTRLSPFRSWISRITAPK